MIVFHHASRPRSLPPRRFVRALVLGLLGIAAYLASNTAFEMLALSRQYAVATTEAERAIPLAAGRAMLVTSTGTTFDVYYVLDAIFLLIVAPVMLRGRRQPTHRAIKSIPYRRHARPSAMTGLVWCNSSCP